MGDLIVRLHEVSLRSADWLTSTCNAHLPSTHGLVPSTAAEVWHAHDAALQRLPSSAADHQVTSSAFALQEGATSSFQAEGSMPEHPPGLSEEHSSCEGSPAAVQPHPDGAPLLVLPPHITANLQQAAAAQSSGRQLHSLEAAAWQGSGDVLGEAMHAKQRPCCTGAVHLYCADRREEWAGGAQGACQPTARFSGPCVRATLLRHLPTVQPLARGAGGLCPDRGKLPGQHFRSHLLCAASLRPANADGRRGRPAEGAAQAARTAMQSWLEWLRRPHLHHNQSRQQQPSGSSSALASIALQQPAGDAHLGRAPPAVPALALHRLPPPSDSSLIRLSGRSRAGRFVESSVEYSTEHSRGSGTAAGEHAGDCLELRQLSVHGGSGMAWGPVLQCGCLCLAVAGVASLTLPQMPAPGNN